MRNPNGFGSVHNTGGRKKRRNPWRARVTDGWELCEKTGKAKQIYRTIGYYPTRQAALIALAEYNKCPAARGTADIDERLLKMIVGHSLGDNITDRYRHSTITTLIEQIDKIKI